MNGFPHSILWGIVNADIDSSDVFSDKPKHNKYQPSNKQKGCDNGAPAQFDGRINKSPYYDEDAVAEA